MKKIFFLIVSITVINISCQKRNVAANNLAKPSIDTLYNQHEKLYFDDDNIKDEAEIHAKPDNEILNYELSVYLSTLNKAIVIPVLNNSILYNNDYSIYYISDPIIRNKVIELQVDYADQITIPNNSGEKKNLIEKIKIRFNPENEKIQIIGYDITYIKNKKSYTKSFNFITGKYYSSCYFNEKKKNTSGWALELQNIYTENWDNIFLNKISFYGNEVE